ncbi:TonB-dependent receptor [Acidobacterium sp. S8]|uniref:TonB-dependent receptor n=1 Tax=Acidobacterium sp. S8 TaxID=1641854 RepID=UPI00131B24A0|nr:TonB-dependent receptor [Acidobacterium sp. S8]
MLGALIFSAGAYAQTGSIIGTVLDPSGATVPKANVTATSNSTGIVQTTVTSSAGVFTFAALSPAHYSVVVSAPGFQDTTLDDVVVTVAQTVPLRVSLAVGGASTTVNVGAESLTPVETDSFQLSTIIDSKKINDLPLILRDPYQLVLLSPGAVTASNNMGGFSVNGQRDRNNNFMLDGADNNDTSVPGGQGGVSSANPDSAQEFRIISNNFDAEFGRNTGAIIDVVTRGGSNQFHGDVYEFGRYNALGARDFFNTKDNGPQDPYVRNDFGASVGGPIWKDHTFFFLNGEAQRFRTTLTNNQIVPTAAYKSGVYTYIDPTDGSQTPVNLTTPGNPNNFSQLGQDPLISHVLSVLPLGQVDNGDGISSTYFYPSPDSLNSYTFIGRFDHALTSRHQLTVRYQYGHSNESNPFHDEVIPGYGAVAVIATTHNGVISLASTLSPSSTNLFRAGYNQNNAGFFCGHAGFDAVTGTDSFGNGRDLFLPYFLSSTGNSFGCAELGDSNGQARLSSTLMFADTYSIVKGAHSLKFGGEYRSIKDSDYDNFSSRDQLSFNVFSDFDAPAYAWNGDPNSPSLNGFEDSVWGAQGAIANETQNQFFTREGVRSPNDLTRFRQHEWAVFGQDTWKVTPNFTAILGMRYEFNGVPYENDGNFSNFYGDASAPLPASGYFTFTSVGPGTGRMLYANNWGMVEPRIGFAYDPVGNGKTVIRGGYGIFHDRIFDNLFGNAKSNPPFQVDYNAFPFTSTPPATPVASTQPYPGTLTPSVNITNGDFNEPVVIDPHLKMPGNQAWNLGVQHQFGDGLGLEVNYVASHSTHVLREVDGAPPQPALVASVISACEANGNSANDCENAAQRTALYEGSAITDPAVNNTAFFHEFYQTAISSANYNALQSKVTYQSGGLSLLGSYTYAHSLDNGSDPLAPGAGNSGFPRNSFDLLPEYGNSDFDVRHRGTAAITYALPIGQGAKYLSNGILGSIFEGIQLSGIQQVQTGLPFDLRGTVDNLHTSVNNRPELIGSPYPSQRGTITANGKITGPSMAAFSNAPFDENVSIHRNKFIGPGFVNTDVVFQKTQTIFEQVKLVFRAESYNVLNHPNLSSPTASSLTLGSPTFGISQSQIQQNDATTGARQIQGALKVVF